MLLLVLAAPVSACGEQEPAVPDPATDRAAIQKRVAAYVGAMLSSDGERACAQFTPRYRHDAETRARGSGLEGCADAIAFYGDSVSTLVTADVAKKVAEPAAVQVTLKGNAAVAAVKVPGGDLSVKRTTLRRVGTRWLIDSLGN
jgi:hypothetical protein